MKPAHRYATATAFRIALEARLKSLAQAEGVDLQRLRRHVSLTGCWRGCFLFAGIPLVPCIAISREQQFAEKLHAYARQRERANSRAKDLMDMALLVKMGMLESPKLKEAIQMTFEQRGTHAVPTVFPDSPESWQRPYAQLAGECGLEWIIDESVLAVASRLVGM